MYFTVPCTCMCIICVLVIIIVYYSYRHSPLQFPKGQSAFLNSNPLRPSSQPRSHSSSPKAHVWSTPSMGSGSSLPITSARKTH